MPTKKYLDEAGAARLVNKILALLNDKVDKENGKSLSEEDFTSLLKTKLEGLENYSLPIATEELLGGIKIGQGLNIDENGVVSAIVSEDDLLNESVNVELGTNGSLGGYKTGDVIPAGTSVETILKKLLAKQIPPTYTAPTVSISNNDGSAAGNYEIGSLITPKIKAVYNKNDGGNIEYIDILKNNGSIFIWEESSATYDESEQALSETLQFKASATYKEGSIKNDNLGDPYPNGHILAGTKTSSNFTFTPYRQGYFWGILNTSSAEQPLTSAIIRNGTKKNGAYSSGDITGIVASTVPNRKRIFIACPATNKGVTKVIMPSAMNADCTADFVKQNETVLVEGANGYSAIAYNIWVYEPAAISDDQTFTITLG